MLDIRKVWRHADYICLIAANQEMGFLCGYVLVPTSHPVAGMSYDDIHAEYPISVHGGLTFSQKIDIVEIGNVDLRGLVPGTKNMWMIGFDCGHAGDAPFFASPMSFMFPQSSGHVWSFDEVAEETESLAEQIASISAAQ